MVEIAFGIVLAWFAIAFYRVTLTIVAVCLFGLAVFVAQFQIETAREEKREQTRQGQSRVNLKYCQEDDSQFWCKHPMDKQ
jgi:mannose/fructose/N-acetylgalactosamine-specific phosphotransferase system component IIC